MYSAGRNTATTAIAPCVGKNAATAAMVVRCGALPHTSSSSAAAAPTITTTTRRTRRALSLCVSTVRGEMRRVPCSSPSYYYSSSVFFLPHTAAASSRGFSTAATESNNKEEATTSPQKESLDGGRKRPQSSPPPPSSSRRRPAAPTLTVHDPSNALVSALHTIQQKYKLFSVGNTIVDVGCLPGTSSRCFRQWIDEREASAAPMMMTEGLGNSEQVKERDGSTPPPSTPREMNNSIDGTITPNSILNGDPNPAISVEAATATHWRAQLLKRQNEKLLKRRQKKNMMTLNSSCNKQVHEDGIQQTVAAALPPPATTLPPSAPAPSLSSSSPPPPARKLGFIIGIDALKTPSPSESGAEGGSVGDGDYSSPPSYYVGDVLVTRTVQELGANPQIFENLTGYTLRQQSSNGSAAINNTSTATNSLSLARHQNGNNKQDSSSSSSSSRSPPQYCDFSGKADIVFIDLCPLLEKELADAATQLVITASKKNSASAAKSQKGRRLELSDTSNENAIADDCDEEKERRQQQQQQKLVQSLLSPFHPSCHPQYYTRLSLPMLHENQLAQTSLAMRKRMRKDQTLLLENEFREMNQKLLAGDNQANGGEGSSTRMLPLSDKGNQNSSTSSPSSSSSSIVAANADTSSFEILSSTASADPNNNRKSLKGTKKHHHHHRNLKSGKSQFYDVVDNTNPFESLLDQLSSAAAEIVGVDEGGGDGIASKNEAQQHQGTALPSPPTTSSSAGSPTPPPTPSSSLSETDKLFLKASANVFKDQVDAETDEMLDKMATSLRYGKEAISGANGSCDGTTQGLLAPTPATRSAGDGIETSSSASSFSMDSNSHSNSSRGGGGSRNRNNNGIVVMRGGSAVFVMNDDSSSGIGAEANGVSTNKINFYAYPEILRAVMKIQCSNNTAQPPTSVSRNNTAIGALEQFKPAPLTTEALFLTSLESTATAVRLLKPYLKPFRELDVEERLLLPTVSSSVESKSSPSSSSSPIPTLKRQNRSPFAPHVRTHQAMATITTKNDVGLFEEKNDPVVGSKSFSFSPPSPSRLSPATSGTAGKFLIRLVIPTEAFAAADSARSDASNNNSHTSSSSSSALAIINASETRNNQHTVATSLGAISGSYHAFIDSLHGHFGSVEVIDVRRIETPPPPAEEEEMEEVGDININNKNKTLIPSSTAAFTAYSQIMILAHNSSTPVVAAEARSAPRAVKDNPAFILFDREILMQHEAEEAAKKMNNTNNGEGGGADNNIGHRRARAHGLKYDLPSANIVLPSGDGVGNVFKRGRKHSDVAAAAAAGGIGGGASGIKPKFRGVYKYLSQASHGSNGNSNDAASIDLSPESQRGRGRFKMNHSSWSPNRGYSKRPDAAPNANAISALHSAITSAAAKNNSRISLQGAGSSSFVFRKRDSFSSLASFTSGGHRAASLQLIGQSTIDASTRTFVFDGDNKSNKKLMGSSYDANISNGSTAHRLSLADGSVASASKSSGGSANRGINNKASRFFTSRYPRLLQAGVLPPSASMVAEHQERLKQVAEEEERSEAAQKRFNDLKMTSIDSGRFHSVVGE